MSEVADGLHSAWKETLRGLKEGYKMTQKAIRKIPPMMDSRNGASLTHGDRRRMFQAKYASSVGTVAPSGGTRPGEELSDAESSDSEILSDEQVKSLVDCKFFDPEYEPAVFEVEHLPEECPREEDAIRGESALVDQKILVLRQQCEVVSVTLKKRVLAHHQAFVLGIEQMRSLNDSLFTTSSDCKKCRKALKKAKSSVTSQLAIVAQKRSMDNAAETVRVLEAMEKMMWKRKQLRALLARGKVMEAAKFLSDEEEIEMEDTLKKVSCMTEILQEWKLFVNNPKKLHESIEQLLNSCFTNTFIPDVYQNAVESSFELTSSAECCSMVEMILWHTAGHIMTRSFVDVSTIKDETAAITDIVAAVEPDHLVIAASSMAAKWMDFFYVFATVRRLHSAALQNSISTDESGCNFSMIHKDLLDRLQRLGPRLARDLMLKLTLLASSCKRSYCFMEADRLVHFFVVLDLAVEGINQTLSPDLTVVKRVRSELFDSVRAALQRSVCIPSVHDLVKAMNEDAWEVSDISVTSVGVLKPLSSKFYDEQVTRVKNYLHIDDSSSEESGSSEMRHDTVKHYMPEGVRENPFRSPLLSEPKNTSGHTESVTFGVYWSDEKMKGSTKKISSSPTVISASGMKLYHTMLSAQLKIVMRFPQLAEQVLGWCEQWVSFYVFTIIDNFVSISRSIPVEDQGDFSSAAQKTLRDLRHSAELAIDARDGVYQNYSYQAKPSSPTAAPESFLKFPPRVIERIRTLFVSEAHQYALGQRAVACESSRAVVALYESAIHSLGPLVEDKSVLQYYLDRCVGMHDLTVEALHVCLHRLSEALLPLQKVCDEIGRLKIRKDEVEVSPYVREMLSELKQLHTRRYPMPTPDLETLFIQRSLFAVQSIAVREYSKLSKRVNDLMAMQLQVDAQNFFQQAGASFGSVNVIIPRHVLTLVKTGFFLQDREQSLAWLEREHAAYHAADMLNWFSCGDRGLRTELELKLKQDLRHVDCLPLKVFFHNQV